MAKKRTVSKRRVPARRTERSAPRPIAGPDAFTDLREPDYVYSQAATLLLIGSNVRGDPAAMQARVEAARAFLPPAATAVSEMIPAEDVQALGFPALAAGAPRFRPEALQRAAGVRFPATPASQPSPRDVRSASRALSSAANAFYRNANSETAGTLLEVSLRHPNELVRVSAAASYLDVAVNAATGIRILEHGLRSRDRLTRDVAAHALAHVDYENPGLARLMRSKKRRSLRKRSRTSLLVHGTWARTDSWWQPPSGDFWTYLHGQVDPNLYGAQDRFEWSGGYSDAARALAGDDLRVWVRQHNLEGLDLFAHSHGGNVAMLANHAGTTVGRLVLLSCPVHWPKYTPDFSAVANKVVSVRVHLDLVILADRGGQRFYDNRIQENVLPLWFDHSATHDPGIWVTYNVPAML
jgi:hypothetical protein